MVPAVMYSILKVLCSCSCALYSCEPVAEFNMKKDFAREVVLRNRSFDKCLLNWFYCLQPWRSILQFLCGLSFVFRYGSEFLRLNEFLLSRD